MDYPPYFRSYKIGSNTAKNIHKNKWDIIHEVLKNEPINKDNDYVAFNLGEIDCRYTIAKKIIIDKLDQNTIINEAIESYFKVFLKLKYDKHYLYNNLLCIGPIASYGGEMSKHIYYGNDIQRNQITLKFNNKLRSLCANENIQFVTLFDYLIDNNMRTKNNFYYDIHLNNKAQPEMINRLKNKEIIK